MNLIVITSLERNLQNDSANGMGNKEKTDNRREKTVEKSTKETKDGEEREGDIKIKI